MDYSKLGLNIIEDFISKEQEEKILNKINKNENVKSKKERNTIQRFGSGAPYNSFIVSKIIPSFLDELGEQLLEKGLVSSKPDSVTINEYLEGQMICPHIDSKPSGPIITILSLLSGATMKFGRKGIDSFSLELPPRSLVQMRDEIRNDWTHAIDPVQSTRYSIVFRCSCDSKKKE